MNVSYDFNPSSFGQVQCHCKEKCKKYSPGPYLSNNEILGILSILKKNAYDLRMCHHFDLVFLSRFKDTGRKNAHLKSGPHLSFG